VDLVLFLGKVLGVTLLVTLVAATHARFRIDQAMRYYLGLMAVSLAALVLALWGF
jgi:formate hydrogenlyase subunit 4